MPRIRSEAACTTCQQRKIRCDEKLPVCGNCLRARRYCDHTRDVRYRHQSTIQRQAADPESSVLSPTGPLKDDTVAKLFTHYVKHLAAWYDLSDGAMHFTKQIPHEALSRPLLFSAIIAFAAIHQSCTTAHSLRSTAELYHGHCIQLLLRLRDTDMQSDDGYNLAAVCLLRSYEILAEDLDPNRHLSGAYALSAATSINMSTSSLGRAGFFNYLREDVTFSLITRRILKMDIAEIKMAETGLDDEDQLNLAALYLAEAINLVFGFGRSDTIAHDNLRISFNRWQDTLPDHFRPFFDSSQNVTPSLFSTIRFLRDCHVAVAQYCLVTSSLLIQRPEQKSNYEDDSSLLETNATRLCAMAFTSNSPAVLVNSFGPISYCGRHIREPALRLDLIRRLHASGRETGWPVKRMIDELQQHWNKTAGGSDLHARRETALTAPG